MMKRQESLQLRQQARGGNLPTHSAHTMSVALGTYAHTTGEKVKYGLYTGVPVGLTVGIFGGGGMSLVVATLAGVAVGYWSEEMGWIIDKLALRKARSGNGNVRNMLAWLFYGKYGMRQQRVAMPNQNNNQDEETVDGTISPAAPLDARFVVPKAEETNGIARLTIAEIVQHTQRNSYKIWVGRSLTKENNPAVLINIYKQHFRFMGASQRGKSSMVAAFLDIVTQTHDVKHVRLILLDKEDQTSNLFAHLPHVLSMKKADGQIVKLHAKSDDQVLEYLIHTVAIMQHRYTLPKLQVLELPIILVYIEEFLALKNEFKARIERAKTKGAQALAKAQSDYATLVYCIEALSQLGLKVRVQLLLCAQVEYRDDDFVEALVNVQCGFSFCVRPTAAAAAGFRNTELVKRNAKENKVGQAVVETPDCNDLVLAPDYDLEALLIAFEKAHPEIHRFTNSTDSPDAFVFEHNQAQSELGNVNRVNDVEPLEKPVNESVNGGERSTEENNVPQRFTPADEVKVLLAYQELLLANPNKKITRTELRDYLGWNSKQYTNILKPICDKHGILMEKEGA